MPAGKDQQQHHQSTEHHQASSHHEAAADTHAEAKQGNIKSAADLAASLAGKRIHWPGMRGSVGKLTFDENNESTGPASADDLEAIAKSFPGAQISAAPDKKDDKAKDDKEAADKEEDGKDAEKAKK